MITAGIHGYTQENVDAIVAAAQANGEGYVPPCNGVVGVVMVPVDSSGGPVQVVAAQSVPTTLGIPCQTTVNTAWAQGPAFGGKDWAMYIYPYTVSAVS